MISIRPIIKTDYPQLLELLEEFAIFEKSMGAVTNTVELMNEQTEFIKGFLAEDDDTAIGYTTYFFPYHTWVGKCIHMDDLFITESYRGKGIGEKLMDAVIEVGKNEDCKRLRWQVSDWNTEAQEFYKRKGAVIKNSEYDCEIIFKS